MSAVAFRAAATNHATSASSVSVTVPAGVQTGDLMLVFLSSTAQQVASIGVPAGWTQRTVRTAYNGYYTWFTRVAAAGEAGTTYNFGTNTVGMISVALVAYSNVDTAAGSSGIVAESFSADMSGGTANSYAASSLTTQNVNNAVVRGWHLYGAFPGNGYSVTNAPAGTNKRANTVSIAGVADSVCMVSDAFYPVAGTATGAQTATSDAVGNWAVDSFELKAINVAPTAPTVTAPNGGETIGNSTTITWTAGTDPDGDVLTYDVDYTRDNGATWVNLATGSSGLSLVWDTSAITLSSACRVRVRSRDTSNLVSAYDESNANFTITHNRAPNPATWASPPNNSTLDRTVAQTLTFNFLDPDAGDVMTKFDYRFRLVGAATWTTTGTLTQASPTIAISAGLLAAGTYEIQVLTYDGQGLAATGWSASLQFVMADPPAGVVITTPASGGTVASNVGVAAWTAPSQTGYQVQQVADAAGVMADPNVPANVYSDTGQVTGTAAAAARNVAQTYPVNNRFQWTRVRIQSGGVWSAWTSVRYQVAYTPPAAVTVGVAAPPAIGDALQITITLTPPGGSQPVVSSIELWRQRFTDQAGGAVSEAPVRVANLVPAAGPTVFTDYGVRSGHGYQYQAIAIGTNTTATRSPWVT